MEEQNQKYQCPSGAIFIFIALTKYWHDFSFSINAHQGQYSFSSIVALCHFERTGINAHQGQYSFSSDRFTDAGKGNMGINAHQGQYSFSCPINIHLYQCPSGAIFIFIAFKARCAYSFEYQCPSGAIFIFIARTKPAWTRARCINAHQGQYSFSLYAKACSMKVAGINAHQGQYSFSSPTTISSIA